MNDFRLLEADEIECRVAMAKANGVSLLLYKDARCDMRILDETVGPMNWQKSYSRDNRNCTVSIWDAEKGQWISKEDTGTESNTEAEKGLASDSFKRACFNWGIGRELYTSPFIWVSNTACNVAAAPGSKSYKCYDRFKVKELGYDDRSRINQLVIYNETTKEICFTFQAKEEPKKEPKPKTISTTKAKALKALLESNEIDISFVCACFKVKELKELTEEQHRNAVEHLECVKRKYEEWKLKEN